MYLTDYRERCLKDVITQLEPGLFKKVTGLDVKDFELLCTMGVFNASLMNDAIFKFKRYEDSSLSYTGIEKRISDDIGGWDTVIRREEYEKLFFNQQATMTGADENNSIGEPIGNSATQNGEVKTMYKPIVAEVKDYAESMSIDISKIAVGAAVFHKNFGDGSIINIDHNRKYMTVQFAEGEKKFVYPDGVTKGYLQLK